jgi:hypothetical protein
VGKDLEIKQENVSREDLCGIFAMGGLRRETHSRCSTLFLAELYIRARSTVIPGDPAKIIAEVRSLEGYGRETWTKEASLFEHRPLLGLWHKHYLADNGLAMNIVQGLGGPKFKRLRSVIEKQHRPGATHFTVDDVPRIAKAVTDVYFERADRRQLTGEWIIFARHEGQNYYLCLGSHTDDDQELCDKIRQTCAGEFPFLDALLNHEPPDKTEQP